MAKNPRESSTSKVSRPMAAPPTDAVALSSREVEDLAYELWQQRGCPEGSPEEDWFAAEQTLRKRKSETSRPRVFSAGSSDSGS